MRIILPKVLASETSDPLFFLMGPIRGGGDWQRECSKLLAAKMQGDFQVAVPCRYKEGHELYQYRAPGTEQFSRQLTWERYYLDQAAWRAKRGCIIVWLPCESKTNPRPREDGPYARDTYGELGEWRGRMMSDKKVRLVLGAEPDFPGLDVIARNFELALDRKFLPFPTLEGLVERAVKMVNEPAAATT